jgi:hypothetical protein
MMPIGKVFYQDKQADVEYSTTDNKEFKISNLPGDTALLHFRKGYSFELITDKNITVSLEITDYAKNMQETRILMKAYIRN